MATTIQVKKGLETNRVKFTPLQGELLFTTDEKKVFIGDGGTPGGVAVGGDFVLKGYVKPAAAGTVMSTDDVKTAIGKLEKGLENAHAGGGDVNVQSDWGITDVGSDAFIKNKPAIPSTFTVVDDLTTGGATNALSAEQGKALKALVDAGTLVGLTDTTITAVKDKDYLYFDDATKKWINKAHEAINLDDIANVNAKAPTANDLLAFDGTNWVPVAKIDLGTF